MAVNKSSRFASSAGLPTSTVLLLAVSLVPSSPSDSPSSLSAMVIAGGDGPSPERAAAWSAVVATPHSGPEKVTTATKPPLPQAPKPVSAVSETILPPAPAAPLAAPESGPFAPVAVLSGPAAPPAPLVAAVEPSIPAPGRPSRPQSPDRHPSRPHSPVPHQDRRSSRRRRDSPRRYQQQPHWAAHPGGQGDWRGYRGRGGGGGYRPPVTMADLQQEVSRAVREEKASQARAARCAPRRSLRFRDSLHSP
ncbi:unnamed protein product [Closterium sp. NIES-53]